MDSQGGTTAYGASLSGGSFDPINFLKQPQTILRLLSWVRNDKRCKEMTDGLDRLVFVCNVKLKHDFVQVLRLVGKV